MFLLDCDTAIEETTADWSSELTFSDDEIDYNAETNFKMFCKSFYKPKRNPAKPLGQDAHFISEDDNTIGVADGVGGCAKKGIDAGVYARKLMLHASVSARNQNLTNGIVNPRKVLWEAFVKTDAQGSSTACVITLRGCYLHCANVGDSKFVVIRAGKVVFRSQVQQRYFNCPYQLGRGKGKNSPDDADLYVYRVKEGDIIVVGSDGLFDNVDEEKLEEMVNREERLEHWAKEMTKKLEKTVNCEKRFARLASEMAKKYSEKMGNREKRLERLAKEMTKFAQKQSKDRTASTPFEKAARLAGVAFRGGKYDDVTVIVACVSTVI